MTKKQKSIKLANTKWSELPEQVLDSVIDSLRRYETDHKNVKTYLNIDEQERVVFFDFSINNVDPEDFKPSDLVINKVVMPTDNGFVVVTEISELNRVRLIYSAFGYLRVL